MYNQFKPTEYEYFPDEARKLIFSCVLYHSILLERSKFGTMGWNNSYDFMNSDFHISYM